MASGPLSPNNRNGARKKSRAPKLWLCADFFSFLRLLARNGFAIGPRQLPWLLPILLVTFRNTCLGYLQTLVWGKRVKEARIVHDPLFIIGHWRSGTTWLHELLTLDPRHNYPTTYQCFFPTHFLLTEWYLSRWLRFLLPDVRPMDSVRLGWDRPQEDEFALCHLGQPSPYLTAAFPNRPPQYPEYFDLESLPPKALTQWKQCFVRFLKQITVRDRRRIVL
ncbi:MAG TPA: sulfotransferase, partial [Candidatus Binatia bacterium]|nr:sulfotransferase [Candidatus Binatia bacterium]